MAENWTPGPWWYQEKSDAYTHIVRQGEHRFICQLGQDTTGWAEANARLIAAAPEIYEKLEDARNNFSELAEWLLNGDGQSMPNEFKRPLFADFQRLRLNYDAALAKARGE